MNLSRACYAELPKKGRRQEEENVFFALCHFLLEQVNLFIVRVACRRQERRKYVF